MFDHHKGNGPISTFMHEKANKRIEVVMKWMYLTDIKYSLSVIFSMIPLFVQNYINYYIFKLGDESFKLPFFAAYVNQFIIIVDKQENQE